MCIRLPCVALLLCLTLNTHAEPVEYAFEGYIASEKIGTDPSMRFPSSFQVGQRFTGYMRFDAERTQPDPDFDFEHPAPVTYFELDIGTDVLISGDGNTSGHSIFRYGGVETLGFGNYGSFSTSEQQFSGTVIFNWASSQIGELPPDLEDFSAIDPANLDPHNWVLDIVHQGACPSSCNPALVHRLKANITGFWRRGSSSGTRYVQQFESAPSGWSTQGGGWVADGAYRNSANVPFTSSVYTGQPLNTSYEIFTSMYSQWSGSGNTLGLVLHYRDSSNFDEIRFNSLGTVSYNQVRNGTRTMLETAAYSAAAPRQWTGVWVSRDGANLHLWVHGQDLLDIDVGTLTGGYAGVFASWNQARFDEFVVSTATSWDRTKFDFTSSAPGWMPVTGTWAPTSGYYYNSANLLAAISTSAPITARDYAIDASMYPEWSNSGNRGGLVYDYRDASNYRAILISVGVRGQYGFTNGTLEAIEVRNGVRRVVQRYPASQAASKEWTPVGVKRIGDVTVITIAGFTYEIIQPVVTGTKRAGLIASYNKVRFDDVVIGTPR